MPFTGYPIPTNLQDAVDTVLAAHVNRVAVAANELQDALDALGLSALLKTGGTLTGPLVLAADADDPLEAVTLQQFLANGSSGRELAYVESSTVQTGITTVVDLTGLDTGDFVVGVRPVYVFLFLPLAYPVTSTNMAVVTITDTSNVVKATGNFALLSTTLTGVPIQVMERISTPGTYRRKGRIARAGSGTINNNLDATTKSYIRAVEM